MAELAVVALEKLVRLPRGQHSIDNRKRKAVEPSDLIDLETGLPKKRFFRSRAHCNPLSHNDSFSYPTQPPDYDWSQHYPKLAEAARVVTSLDIGMGFGGLTIALAELFPEKLVLGMEIRPKVTEYVRLRIDGLRESKPGEYQKASCMRTNCMRYLPNFFRQGQMEQIYICFPDPHFKVFSH
jgi:tRNA (guanine-N7-)-methyltransferase